MSTKIILLNPGLARRYLKFDSCHKVPLKRNSTTHLSDLADLPSPRAMGSKIWPIAVMLLALIVGFEGRTFLWYSSF